MAFTPALCPSVFLAAGFTNFSPVIICAGLDLRTETQNLRSSQGISRTSAAQFLSAWHCEKVSARACTSLKGCRSADMGAAQVKETFMRARFCNLLGPRERARAPGPVNFW